MFDRLTSIEDGLIHHGDNNKRIYIMKVPTDNVPRFLDRVEIMAGDNGYEKIVAKVSTGLRDLFEQREYEKEAVIPGFFSGRKDCVFMSRFLFEERREMADAKILDDVLQTAKGCVPQKPQMKLSADMICRKANLQDCDQMADLYKQVFASYPFPIHDSEYIKETMEYNVIYYGVWKNNKLVALASAELDRVEKNAEMTDFAVLPEQRGQNLGAILLARLEDELKQNEDIVTL